MMGYTYVYQISHVHHSPILIPAFPTVQYYRTQYDCSTHTSLTVGCPPIRFRPVSPLPFSLPRVSTDVYPTKKCVPRGHHFSSTLLLFLFERWGTRSLTESLSVITCADQKRHQLLWPDRKKVERSSLRSAHPPFGEVSLFEVRMRRLGSLSISSSRVSLCTYVLPLARDILLVGDNALLVAPSPVGNYDWDVRSSIRFCSPVSSASSPPIIH